MLYYCNLGTFSFTYVWRILYPHGGAFTFFNRSLNLIVLERLPALILLQGTKRCSYLSLFSQLNKPFP